ncbi:helix-turn-helix domain-containing protein [Novosphingobium colocasiae]|uniref:helix-turn-helix domain-containing protein n=1 Tax=Novosphingobium colocasiae TaxID=1256513 RepID=UPI0035B08D2D
MTVGTRLKEERARLGLTQEALAAVANVAKNTAINWEKDKSSPTANALMLIADAGADAIYILTGKRAPDPLSDNDLIVEEELREIERELFQPRRRPGESAAETDARTCRDMAPKLESLARYEAPTDQQKERIAALLKCCGDVRALEVYRVTRSAQEKQERDDTEELLGLWFRDGEYQPDYAVMQMLVMIAMEYHVPYKVLVELCQGVAHDVDELRWAEGVIRHEERRTKGAAGKD